MIELGSEMLGRLESWITTNTDQDGLRIFRCTPAHWVRAITAGMATAMVRPVMEKARRDLARRSTRYAG